MPGAGHLARVQGLDPRGSEGKFLLRRHDILMCYRGTEATIGRVGLVVTAPDEPTICGQSIFVIRVVDGDPVWLYYHFRLEQVRQRILSRCSGRSMLTVNIGEMRNLLVAKPDQSQSATINSRHEGLLTTMCEVKTLLDKAGEEIGTIEREVY
jgi:restriction endonuclease S subunit